MKNKLTRTMFGIPLAALIFTLAVKFEARATPPSGLVNIPVVRGTNVSHGTIPLQAGTDIAMAQITVDPGGSAGWHSHPGGAIVVVKAGTLSVYRSLGGQCQTETRSAGEAFIERPGEVDNVFNAGSTPYVLFVTFPRVPQGESPRIDEPDPGTCPGL
ncbi:MAG: cupin domain-containing protein [Bryobacteraceae bacterium]